MTLFVFLSTAYSFGNLFLRNEKVSKNNEINLELSLYFEILLQWTFESAWCILISIFSYMYKYQIIETSANDKAFEVEVFLIKEPNGTSNKNWWDKCLEPLCVRRLTEIGFRCLGNSYPFRVCANFWVLKWLFFSQAQ